MRDEMTAGTAADVDINLHGARTDQSSTLRDLALSRFATGLMIKTKSDPRPKKKKGRT
jgi:hypothetical protein